jgi:hypothetical protein
VQFWWVVTCCIRQYRICIILWLQYFTGALLFFCWSPGWKIATNDSQQYILVALNGNDTNICSDWWRGNSDPNTFCIHWKNFLTNFGILHFPTQWFLAKRAMWDSVLVIWPYVTFHVMELNMSKKFNCVFLEDSDRCDERP